VPAIASRDDSMMRRASLIALTLLTGCAGSHGSDGGGRDAAIWDSSFADSSVSDAFTARLELTTPLGSCDADEQARCGCIDGLRRCDTCADPCPHGSACDENAGVCRRRDLPTPTDYDGSTWGDACDLTIPNGADLAPDAEVPFHFYYCHTGKVCGAGARQVLETAFDTMGGLCYPVSFCQAAAVADPPVDTLHCVYSDGSAVIDGPPATGACPVGDPRQPYCGGVCGDNLRCPRSPYTPFFGDPRVPVPDQPAQCVAFSEQRAFGVCAYPHECVRGLDSANDVWLRICAMDYGEPCACLVTHEPPDASPPLQGYYVLASVCHDYQLHFPGSTDCVDAAWNPLPPP